MEFRTTQLQVRPISPDDREQVLDLLTDPVVGKTYMLPQCAFRKEAEPLFRRLMDLSHDPGRYVSGIYLNDRFIGIVNETEVRNTHIEIGYALLPAYYNRGYATECLEGTIKYLFSHGFETVICGAFSENAASIRVMEKCGMSRQPETDTIDYRGHRYICCYYSILKESVYV